MDLRVSEGVLGLSDNVLGEHGNVGGLGLARINVFNQGVAGGALPEKKALPVLDGADLRQQLARLVRRNLAQGLRVEEGTQHPPRLRGDPDLSKRRLPDNAGLHVDAPAPLRLPEKFQHRESIVLCECSQPGPVQKEARGRMLLPHTCRLQRLQGAGRLDELLDRLGVAVDADDGRGGHVLHHTYRVSLRSLRRTNEAPLGIMQLAGSDELARFLNRG